MPFVQSSEFAAAFRAFGLTPAGTSIYAFNPVFRVCFPGQEAVLKRTQALANAPRVGHWARALQAAGVQVVTPLAGARETDGRTWVVYPFIQGREYDGSRADIRAAGRLLGQMHAVQSDVLVRFQWPDNTPESIQEDVEGLEQLRETGKLEALVAGLLISWEQAFNTDVYAPLQAADVPWVDASMDFKANNLVYGPDGLPTLVDPDNGEYVPRILDLALAALLFHLDLPAPGRLFSVEEWREFLAGYAELVTLTEPERTLWPLALRYILQEWGVWHLTSDEEGWENVVQQAFLRDLAHLEVGRFPLPE